MNNIKNSMADRQGPHWAHCANTVIRYPLVSKPLGAPDETIQAANVNPWQFLQIIHVVSTQVHSSPLAKSRACTQQVRDSILFFLISAASAEVVNKLSKPNASLMCTHFAMPLNDTDNSTKRASLKFKQTHCTPFILPRLDFTSRSTHVLGRPTVVDGINDRILSYQLACPHRNAKIRELIAVFVGRAPPGKCHVPCALCPDTHTVCVLYRFAILLIYLRQPYIALEFITLKLRALIAAWLSESMVTFRLETLSSSIIFVAECFATSSD